MSDKVYAPNVHLFAYHLCKKTDLSFDRETLADDRKELADRYQKIFQTLGLVQDDFKLEEFQSDRRLPLYRDKSTGEPAFFPLQKQQEREDTIQITGQACPVQLYDSYGLIFNIRVDERDKNNKPSPAVDIKKFFGEVLNPEKCLLLGDDANLGQTVLLTAWLDLEPKDYRVIADRCIHGFLHLDGNQSCPPLYQKSELFGQPLFEYGNPRSLDPKFGHLLVWLFTKKKNHFKNAADTNFVKCYQDFIDIFFYFHKATRAYADSRSIYKGVGEKNGIQEIYKGTREKNGIQEIYKAIKETIEDLNFDDLSELQEKLKNLPIQALKYERLLRELSERRLSIKLATRNYETRVKQIQDKLARREDLELPARNITFLSDFSKKTLRGLQDQIDADIAYSANFFGVTAQAIAAIRGIVEIEQARLDKQNQQAEKEREKELQLTILAVGAGVSAGGILASSSGHLDAESLSLTTVKNPQLYLFVDSIVWSLLFGVAIGFLAYGIVKAIDRLLNRR